MSVMQPWPGLQINFSRRSISAFLSLPHRVLSSCRVHGGLREDLACLCNYQLCEPLEHMDAVPPSACANPAEHLAGLAEELGLPGRAAFLLTAANMQCSGQGLEEFLGQKVLAVATAGVDGNAARAGDPASFAESASGICDLQPGTINIMLFMNTPLAPGAMLEAAMLAAEAKCAVLQELSVPSRYSGGIATGTGTDGLALAAPLEGEFVLTNAGKHSKLGEMIGRAVRAALFESLGRQNSMLPPMRCNLLKILARFGLDEKALLAAARELLPNGAAGLFEANLTGLVTDPLTAGAAAALAHVLDQGSWGVLPPAAQADLLLDYAALMAVRAGGREELAGLYRSELAARMGASLDPSAAAASALVLGFRDKWK